MDKNNGVAEMEKELKSIDYESFVTSDGNISDKEELHLEVEIIESLRETDSRTDSRVEITIIRPAEDNKQHYMYRKNPERKREKSNKIFYDGKLCWKTSIVNPNEKFDIDMDEIEFKQLVEEQHHQIALTVQKLETRMTQIRSSQNATKPLRNNFSYYIYLDKPENDMWNGSIDSQSKQEALSFKSAKHNLIPTRGPTTHESYLQQTMYSEKCQIPKVGVSVIKELSESLPKSYGTPQIDKDNEECYEILYTNRNSLTMSSSHSLESFSPDNNYKNIALQQLNHISSSNSQGSLVKIPTPHLPEHSKYQKANQTIKSAEILTDTGAADSNLQPTVRNYLQSHLFNSPKYNFKVHTKKNIFGAKKLYTCKQKKSHIKQCSSETSQTKDLDISCVKSLQPQPVLSISSISSQTKCNKLKLNVQNPESYTSPAVHKDFKPYSQKVNLENSEKHQDSSNMSQQYKTKDSHSIPIAEQYSENRVTNVSARNSEHTPYELLRNPILAESDKQGSITPQASSWSKPHDSLVTECKQPELLDLYINGRIKSSHNQDNSLEHSFHNLHIQSPNQYSIYETQVSEKCLDEPAFCGNNVILHLIKDENNISKFLHNVSSKISEKVDLSNKSSCHNFQTPTTLRMQQNYCGLFCNHTSNNQNSSHWFHQRFDNNRRKKRGPSTNVICSGESKKGKNKHAMDKMTTPEKQLYPRKDTHILNAKPTNQDNNVKYGEKVMFWNGNIIACMNSRNSLDSLGPVSCISTTKHDGKTQFQENERKLCYQDYVTKATYMPLSEGNILSNILSISRSSSHINPQSNKLYAVSDPINAIPNNEVHALKRKMELTKEGLKQIFRKKLRRKKKQHSKDDERWHSTSARLEVEFNRKPI